MAYHNQRSQPGQPVSEDSNPASQGCFCLHEFYLGRSCSEYSPVQARLDALDRDDVQVLGTGVVGTVHDRRRRQRQRRAELVTSSGGLLAHPASHHSQVQTDKHNISRLAPKPDTPATRCSKSIIFDRHALLRGVMPAAVMPRQSAEWARPAGTPILQLHRAAPPQHQCPSRYA